MCCLANLRCYMLKLTVSALKCHLPRTDKRQDAVRIITFNMSVKQ